MPAAPYEHTPRHFLREIVVRGLPGLLWVAGFLTLIIGGSAVVAWQFGVKHIVWAAVIVLVALLVVVLGGSYRLVRDLARERDALTTADHERPPREGPNIVAVQGNAGATI